ncbi:phosphodiester glycosidase family protein [Chamaesiphon sp. VAR_48_metabat_135_sub]|uniref:phosphodiester glycosidase family protein n=1 Tax=Chamaesiphon sp. VAR_48_metabat_135_sub TaxID=2964699 RepID=UPI00286C1493|nr:phosphodiester glycosidase family protein [Chamaesiphon sp. VAR_48_metabat_135_sub]
MSHQCDSHSQRRLLRQILIALPIFILTGCIRSNQAITPPSPQPSPTFQSTSLAPGITIWTNAAKKTYVIEADLSKAELRSLSGAPTSTGKVGQFKFEEFWTKNKSKGNLQVLINGTFFQEYNKPTGIAFGLKQDNQFITYGYGLNEFPDQTMTVAWSNDKISIEPYSRSTFNSDTSNVVGALAPTAGKNANRLLPRTFIGIKHQQRTADTVLLFISPSSSQREAEQTLQTFGAENTAMLDGGQSTGLIVGGKTMMQPKTRLPQTIGIFSK